jgi:DNA-directed RNA polymerase subunit N (RpoN/RPB10)
MDNEAFDPELLKKAAAAISESLTSSAAEKEQAKRSDEDIKKKITHVPTVRCDSCGHFVFKPGTLFKRFSAADSPTGEDMLVPVEVYECGSCGHVNKEFMPSFLTMDIEKKDAMGYPTY